LLNGSHPGSGGQLQIDSLSLNDEDSGRSCLTNYDKMFLALLQYIL